MKTSVTIVRPSVPIRGTGYEKRHYSLKMKLYDVLGRTPAGCMHPNEHVQHAKLKEDSDLTKKESKLRQTENKISKNKEQKMCQQPDLNLHP